VAGTASICLSSLKELSIKTPRLFTHEQQFESLGLRTLFKLEVSDSPKISSRLWGKMQSNLLIDV